MKAKLLLFVCFVGLILTSCHQKGKSTLANLSSATGQAYEVLVVMDTTLRKGPVGEQVKEILSSDVPGLPQSEPNFRVSWVSPSHFDKILKPVRNILFVQVSDMSTQPKLSFAKDVWAKGQMIMYLKAPNAVSIEEFLSSEAHQQQIIDFFVNSELNRVVRQLKESYNKDASEQLFKTLGVEMNIPGELSQTMIGKDFFWVSNNKNNERLDIVVYSVPYREKDAFTPEKVLARRDSVMKANIPGGPEGSYMATQKALTPLYREFNLGGKYVGEMRGLWEVRGDVMGGPFVSFTRLDEANHRIITAEAFVYAAGKKKRNLIRRLEASLYTLKLPQDNMLPEIPVTVDNNNNNSKN